MIQSRYIYEGQQPTKEELDELEIMDKKAINLEDIPEITKEEYEIAINKNNSVAVAI